VRLADDRVVVMREPDVDRVLKDPARFRSRGRVDTGNVRPRIPVDIDPPDHARYRRILDPLLAPKAIAPVAGGARELAGELIDRFAGAGGCDFAVDFAVPWPSQVFLRVMGLPASDLPELLRLKDVAIHAGGGDAADEQRRVVGQEIYAYFDRHLDQAGGGLIVQVREAELDGRRLTHEELLDVFYLFVLAGLDTVTASLECFIAFLADHPAHRRRIVEEPGIIPAAVEELLRWETPVEVVPRVLGIETALHGERLAPETWVHAHLGSANTDARAFERPYDVDFDRPANPHYAFGKGIHRCLGSHLARLELRIAMEEFHRRVPEYRLDETAELTWRPGIRSVEHLPLVFG
jgi:cytochrome P450